MPKFIKVLLLVVFLLVVGAVVGLYSYDNRHSSQQFQTLMAEGMSAESARQYTQAVQDFTSAISSATTAGDASNARLALANALLFRQEGQDIENAISLLATVATDTSAPAQPRARAYARLGSFYSIGGGNAGFRKILNLPAFSGHLSSTGGDLTKSALLLYEKAYELQPDPTSAFRIASLDATILNENGTYNPKDPEQLQIANNAYTAVQEGDSLLDTLASSTPIYSLAPMYSSRSLALNVLSYYLPQVTNAVVDDSYDKTLALLDQASSSPLLVSQSVFMRLSYAASLQAREPGKQNAKVKALLNEFVAGAGKNPQINSVVLRIRSYKPGTPILTVMPELAKLSPSLKAYLAQLGWNL